MMLFGHKYRLEVYLKTIPHQMKPSRDFSFSVKVPPVKVIAMLI